MLKALGPSMQRKAAQGLEEAIKRTWRVFQTAHSPVSKSQAVHALGTSYAPAVAPPAQVSTAAPATMDLKAMRQVSSHQSALSFGAPRQGFVSFGVAHHHYNAFSGSSREFAQINSFQQERHRGRLNEQR